MWTKVIGYLSVFKWKAEPEFKNTSVFWNKRSSARGSSEGQVLKLGRRNANTTYGILGVVAVLSKYGEVVCTMR